MAVGDERRNAVGPVASELKRSDPGKTIAMPMRIAVIPTRSDCAIQEFCRS
jgi:hypothetical protein